MKAFRVMKSFSLHVSTSPKKVSPVYKPNSIGIVKSI